MPQPDAGSSNTHVLAVTLQFQHKFDTIEEIRGFQNRIAGWIKDLQQLEDVRVKSAVRMDGVTVNLDMMG